MLRYLAFLALLAITPAAAQDSNFPTPGNARVPGYVTMCLNGSNQAIPCAAGGGLAAGAAVTGCPAQANLFITSTLTLGCVSAVSQTDTGSLSSITALSIGGAAIGGNALAITGTVGVSGATVVGGTVTATNFANAAAGLYSWGGRGIISSPAANTVQIGNIDSSGPTAQSILFQSALTSSNIAGQNATIGGSASTGSGTSGDLIFSTGGTGAGAAVQNTRVPALVLKGATQLVTLPAITTDATHTDSTLCQDTTSHAVYFGSGTAGICLGTSSMRFKHDIAPLEAGLNELLHIDTVTYRYNADHGDPDHKLYGFTAEQMQTVLPELVRPDAQGRPNSIDWAGLVPVLVKAIQQQQAEIEALKRRVH